MRRNYVWESLYVSAVLETDDAKLVKRIAEARAAINARYDRLPAGSTDERDAIAKALDGLRMLRDERLAGRHTHVVSRIREFVG